MANNRLYLKCNACGGMLFLGKSFAAGFYYHDYENNENHLEDRLNSFYDKHTWCSDTGDGDFSLEYECGSPYSWFHKYKITFDEADKEIIFCEGCGYETDKMTKFCPECGRQLIG